MKSKLEASSLFLTKYSLLNKNKKLYTQKVHLNYGNKRYLE